MMKSGQSRWRIPTAVLLSSALALTACGSPTASPDSVRTNPVQTNTEEAKEDVGWVEWGTGKATDALTDYLSGNWKGLVSSGLGWLGIDASAIFGDEGPSELAVVNQTLQEISSKLDETNRLLGKVDQQLDSLNKAFNKKACTDNAQAISDEIATVKNLYHSYKTFLITGINEHSANKVKQKPNGKLKSPQTIVEQQDQWAAEILNDQPARPALYKVLEKISDELLLETDSVVGILYSCIPGQYGIVWENEVKQGSVKQVDEYYALMNRLVGYYLTLQTQGLIALASAAQYNAARSLELAGYQGELAEFGISSQPGQTDPKSLKSMCQVVQSINNTPDGMSKDKYQLILGAKNKCNGVYGSNNGQGQVLQGQLDIIRDKMAAQLRLIGEPFSAVTVPNPRAGQPGQPERIPGVLQRVGGDHVAPRSLTAFTAQTTPNAPCLSEDKSAINGQANACGPAANVNYGQLSGNWNPVQYAGINAWADRMSFNELKSDIFAGWVAKEQALRESMNDANAGYQPESIVLSSPDAVVSPHNLFGCFEDRRNQRSDHCTKAEPMQLRRWIDTNFRYPFEKSSDVGEQLKYIAPGGDRTSIYFPPSIPPSRFSNRGWYGARSSDGLGARYWDRHDGLDRLLLDGLDHKWQSQTSLGGSGQQWALNSGWLNPAPQPIGAYTWPKLTYKEFEDRNGGCSTINRFTGLRTICGPLLEKSIEARLPKFSQ